MRVIGIITTVVVAAAVVTLIVVLIMSLPDIKRYRRIRSM